VVVFHYAEHCQRYFTNFPFSFEYGRYGVQLFFVISGFFIYQTIEKCRGAKEFLLLRFSRLYPAYWAALAIGLAVDWAQVGHKVWINGYVVNATMFQSWLGFPDTDLVFWTLAVEMAFYLLMAVLLVTRALRFPLFVSVVWLALANLWPWMEASAVAKLSFVHAAAQLLVYGPFFIAGMMFHRLKSRGNQPFVYPLGIVILCALTAWHTGGLLMGTVAVTVFLLMAMAMLGWLEFLVSPVTLWLGAISYSLYLVHRNLGYAALFKLYALGLDSRLAFTVVLGGALALASALTYGLEQPLLRRVRGWIRSR
jgi:peptidoglycan/LPS O-acetylase OafA/YrhL